MPDKKPADKKPAAGKIFDVSRPGKALATPASKPVIMGHKPEAQAAQTAVSGIGESRPMLAKRKIEINPFGGQSPSAPAQTADPALEKPAQPTTQEADAVGAVAVEATGVPEVPVTPSQPKRISPLSIGITDGSKPEVDSPEPEEAPSAEAADSAPAQSAPELQPSAEPDTEAEPTVETMPEAIPEPEPTPGSTPEPEPEPKPTERKESPIMSEEMPADSSSMPAEETARPAGPPSQEAEAAPEPKIEPLFDDSGRVVVSMHGHPHHHGAHVAGLLLLILLLAILGLNVALDLGLLKVPGLPHTDLL
jgi:hypothetical protein